MRYLADLSAGKIALWCFLIWYLATVIHHFDATPAIWLNALGISALIGVALYLSRRLWLAPRMFTNYSQMVECLGAILPGREHPVRVFAPLPRLAVLLPGICAIDVICLLFLAGATIACAWWLI